MLPMWLRKTDRSITPRRRGPIRRLLRWILLAVLVLALADAVYLMTVWPDWAAYRQGPVPESNFMRSYRNAQAARPDWPPLRWRPVSIGDIPRHLIRAVIVAEDARFYAHEGVDLEALKEAMQTNLSQGRLAYGGSTISQQTVKNLFLSPSRDPLRKWHELVLTFAMERHLSKRRILELYLNVAEFGRGVYGVGAAAEHYWDVPVTRITARESIELAATLPSPVLNNPRSNTRAFRNRVSRIRRYF